MAVARFGVRCVEIWKAQRNVYREAMEAEGVARQQCAKGNRCKAITWLK